MVLCVLPKNKEVTHNGKNQNRRPILRKKYHIKNAVYEKAKRAQIDSCADGGRAWCEQEFIRQTLIAINKIQMNGDCISDEELGDAVTVSAVEKIVCDAYPVERELGIVLLSAMENVENQSPGDGYEVLEFIIVKCN